MLYLDKTYWHISLLSLAVSDSGIDQDLIKETNQDFIKNTLSIEKIDKVEFDFEDKFKYESYSNNPTLEFIRAIDGKSEYTIDELKEIFEREGYIADEVYKHLYLALTPEGSKIIRDIKIIFNQHLTVEDLSEGEKKLLLLKAAFEFAGQNDSLFILDEPDSHVHLNNKELIVKTFEPYKKNRQIILTTHSPTVTQCIHEDELYMVDKGKVIERRKQEIIGDLTDEFWNKHQQNVFLASTKNLILFVEGKHDKMHIENALEKLKDEYKNLDFDIFSLGGEKKIHPFMVGLYETDIKENVIYIGIYDNDKAGTDTLSNAGFDKETNDCGYRKLKKDKKSHNNFFAFALIKPQDFTKDCTIENMYNSEKYEEAYKKALEKRIGNFSNESIDGISKNIKDDSKNILAENSKTFEKEDFKSFKPLLDLILKIKKDCSKNKPADTKTNDDSEKTEKPLKEDEPIQVENIPNNAKGTKKISKEDQSAQVENTTNADVFYFKTKGVWAKGKYNGQDHSFTLMNGSEIVRNCVLSAGKNFKEKRAKTLKGIKHQIQKRSYLIEEDVSFRSPSGASDFVIGGSSNGWKVWKNAAGKTLEEIYRGKSA